MDEKKLSQMVDASIMRRYESDSRSERPLIAADILDGVNYERERCAKIAEAFGAQAGNDAAGGIAHAIAQQIRSGRG